MVMYSELERTGKEATAVHIKALLWHSPGGTMEDEKTPHK
jgi:hypothetical protein